LNDTGYRTDVEDSESEPGLRDTIAYFHPRGIDYFSPESHVVQAADAEVEPAAEAFSESETEIADSEEYF